MASRAEKLFDCPLWDGCLVTGPGHEVALCTFPGGASGAVSFAALEEALSGRDAAVSRGLEVCRQRYEVYQFGRTDAGDVELAYGRLPDSSRGACLARHSASGLCGLVTYPWPVLSPEAVPPLVRGLREYAALGGPGGKPGVAPGGAGGAGPTGAEGGASGPEGPEGGKA